MISNKQTAHYLKQLQELHPSAFKRNFILYGQIKTKGILDELKELIPFGLALMIFVPLSYVLSEYIESFQPKYEGFQASAIASLIIMLFFMLISPIVLKQIKHSSVSLYAQLKNTPLKLTVLILLQAINFAFIESWFLQGILFFFAMSFGFIKFYKENMYREKTTNEQYYYLQEIRRACYWSYKQSVKLYIQLFFTNKASARFKELQHQKSQIADLHTELMNYENKLCMTHKHIDIDKYLDDIL